jgi:predicted Zn-dependent protease
MARSNSLSRRASTVEKFALFLMLNLFAPHASFAEISPASSYLDAQGLIRKGKWAEAVLELQKALQEQPGFFPAELQLSAALVRLDRRSEALGLLNRWALEASDDQKRLLIDRIQVLSRVFLTGETAQAYFDGVNALNAFRVSDAKTRLQQAFEKEKDNMEVLLRLGQLAILEADFDTAVEQLKQARQLNPYEPQIKLWLGRALFKRGELQLGIEALQDASNALPSSEVASIWLGEALALSGKQSQAVDLLDRDIRQHADHPYSVLTRAKLVLTQTDLNEQSLKEMKTGLQGLLVALKEASHPRPSEGELGLRPYDPQDLKKEIQTTIERIGLRIAREEP